MAWWPAARRRCPRSQNGSECSLVEVGPDDSVGTERPLVFYNGVFLFYLCYMKDNFSHQSGEYVKYRPVYPAALYEFIMERVHTKERAWDCATGNGQAAKALAGYFSHVDASDISSRQIEHAVQAQNLTYSVQPADKTGYPENCFDLVTVAQALHWLPFDSFFEEVKRVAKPGAYLAAWMYDLPDITRDIDAIVKVFYSETLHGCWDAERKHVDNHYRDIPWPFDEIVCPLFYMQSEMTADEFIGYVGTWSAIRNFIVRNNYNPTEALGKAILPYWAQEKMTVRFPVYLRMGKVRK